jgi:hypothetical protein
MGRVTMPIELMNETLLGLGLNIGQFARTVQGRALIQQDKMFLLDGMIWQGHEGKPIECDYRVCTREEIENAIECDSHTKNQVLLKMKQQEDALEASRQKEQMEMDQRRLQSIAAQSTVELNERLKQGLAPAQPTEVSEQDEKAILVALAEKHGVKLMEQKKK